MTMKTLLLVLVTLFTVITKSEQKFTIPDITIKALDPKGLLVSIPDSNGIQLFAFHGNVNQAIKGKEDGQINKAITNAEKGLWSFTEPNVQLKPGDIIYYWIFVQHNRLGFDKQEQQYSVTQLVNADSPSVPVVTCVTSVTKMNGGNPTCANHLLFEDNFNTLDESKWQREQYVTWTPDYECVTYEKRPENSYINDGNLVLKATLRDNPDITNLDLTNGCTGVNCSITPFATIVAPVIAGKMKAKFSFLYGRIEIRAQFPRGDWIFPELYLQPQSNDYGDGYGSGRIWVAYARGNQDLLTVNNDQIGNSVLYGGPVLGIKEPVRTQAAIKVTGKAWGEDFHTYTLIWAPDSMQFLVDGENKGTVRPPGGAFSTVQTVSGYEYASAWNTNMAPFDKEFTIALGIGAGGRSDFPERCVSGGSVKPWKNIGVKLNWEFYNAKDKWFPTWTGDNSALKIDYVKVWAL